jgi:hypothetical protein
MNVYIQGKHLSNVQSVIRLIVLDTVSDSTFCFMQTIGHMSAYSVGRDLDGRIFSSLTYVHTQENDPLLAMYVAVPSSKKGTVTSTSKDMHYNSEMHKYFECILTVSKV